jgi:diguanylate cyclase (GGDEF)-like protein/PAS domain S-box-containing protein
MLKFAARMVTVTALEALGCYVSVAFTRGFDGISSIWLATGVLVGVMLTSPPRDAPAYLLAGFLGQLLAKLFVGDPLGLTLALTCANLVEAALVVAAVRRYGGAVDRVEGMPRTGRAATLGTLVACAVSTGIAMAAQFLLRGMSPWRVALYWYPSHVLGMVIFATLTIVVVVQGARLLGRPGERRAFLLALILMAATSLALFEQTRYPVSFLALPPLLMLSYRHGFAGVALGTCVLALVATALTVAGHGPFNLMPGMDLAHRAIMLQLYLGTICLIGLPIAFSLTEQRRLAQKVSESERRYRILADHARDLVVRIRADGRRVYVSPSSREILGWTPEELMAPRWELVHPEDRADLVAAMQTLFAEGGHRTVAFRVQHRDGRYVWIEANATRVAGDHGGFEIIYAGRDVTRRVAAETELQRKEHQLRAVTDNMPAMISRLDRDVRYVFASPNVGRFFGLDPASLIGRSMREVRGDAYYESLRPHIEAALRGERASFDFEAQTQDGLRYFHAEFIPDFAADGRVDGFYAMGVDITPQKLAEQALSKQARQDSLTGLANRRHFEERLGQALERSARSGAPVALMCLDVDRFKQLNDSLGHAGGDAVLVQFARRLETCVRGIDLVARLGGDEFVVLLEQVESADVPEQIAQRLVQVMAQPMRVEGRDVWVTTSIGIGYAQHPRDGDTLMRLADAALYGAKEAGRNTYRLRDDGRGKPLLH